MKEIQLTQGKIALVDDEDFEWLIQWKWRAHKEGRHFYAIANIGKFPNQKQIRMHRILISASDDLFVDHKDRDTLNNQKNNLRECTVSQNTANSRPYSTNKCGYKGVRWVEKNQKYRSTITFHGKKIHIGMFSDIIEAAKAYDVAAKELFEEFAGTNF